MVHENTKKTQTQTKMQIQRQIQRQRQEKVQNTFFYTLEPLWKSALNHTQLSGTSATESYLYSISVSIYTTVYRVYILYLSVYLYSILYICIIQDIIDHSIYLLAIAKMTTIRTCDVCHCGKVSLVCRVSKVWKIQIHLITLYTVAICITCVIFDADSTTQIAS